MLFDFRKILKKETLLNVKKLTFLSHLCKRKLKYNYNLLNNFLVLNLSFQPFLSYTPAVILSILLSLLFFFSWQPIMDRAIFGKPALQQY